MGKIGRMNTKLKALLGHYSQSHQNPTNTKIHKLAVPLIMMSLLGLLFQLSWNNIHAGWVLVGVALLYYSQFKEWKVFAFVLSQLIPMLVVIRFQPFPPIPFFLTIFVLAWIAQFIGHKIEGKKPSFFEDLQYLLIGPVWILKGVFWKEKI